MANVFSYSNVLISVQEEFKLDECNLLHSNKECCVRARCILIYILLDHKFTETSVSELMKLKPQTIYKIKKEKELRMKSDFLLKNLYQSISNKFVMNLQ